MNNKKFLFPFGFSDVFHVDLLAGIFSSEDVVPDSLRKDAPSSHQRPLVAESERDRPLSAAPSAAPQPSSLQGPSAAWGSAQSCGRSNHCGEKKRKKILTYVLILSQACFSLKEHAN